MMSEIIRHSSYSVREISPVGGEECTVERIFERGEYSLRYTTVNE